MEKQSNLLSKWYFVVEFFEFTSEKEEDMFSTGPDFLNVEEAIEVAKNYTSKATLMQRGTIKRLIGEILLIGEIENE